MTAEILSSEEPLTTDAQSLSRKSWKPYIGTGLSMATCYAKVIAVALLPAIGATWEFNPHVQAVLMWGFALIAVVSLYQAKDSHGDPRPFYIGLSGLVVLVGTLYTYYHLTILFLGYILLLIGAFANQSAILKKLKSQVETQAAELTEWNKTLGERVTKQVAELDRVGQLKRFLAPEVVDIIVEKNDKSLLASHRRYVAVLFCDLRGFTAFSETAEPEEVFNVLQQYHLELGRLVAEFDGTIDHRAGDGLMVIFNDPLPCDEPVAQAVNLGFAMHKAVQELREEWSNLGYDLGFGIGVAAGYATLGVVGDERRSDYTAIGNVINFASRLCDQASDGEVLINKRAYIDVEGTISANVKSGMVLKGVSRQQEVYSVSPLD